MKSTLTALSILAASSGMALAAGDAEAGKKVFNQCQTCHVVAAPDGTVLAGKNAKTGPNLYGVIGRPAASVEGFNTATASSKPRPRASSGTKRRSRSMSRIRPSSSTNSPATPS